MFVGHYGVSYWVKSRDKRIPLWVLFLAVQIVDVFWAIFVLAGVEKVRIVPGITATNPLDLYYMPYTHSLLATAVWFGVGFAAYRWAGAARWENGRAALWVAVAVASHWVLDLIVHRADLPLYDDAMKVGLGLWNLPAPAFLLEAALALGGIALYMRATSGATALARFGMPVFGVVMLAVQASVFFGPPPPSPEAIAVTALVSYFAFAAIAGWLDRKRT